MDLHVAGLTMWISLYCVVLENILPPLPWKFFLVWIPHSPPWNFQFSFILSFKNFGFWDPVPLRISNDLPWGYGYFMEWHILLYSNTHVFFCGWLFPVRITEKMFTSTGGKMEQIKISKTSSWLTRKYLAGQFLIMTMILQYLLGCVTVCQLWLVSQALRHGLAISGPWGWVTLWLSRSMFSQEALASNLFFL